MLNKEEKKKTCFVIAPIGEQDTETRKRSDKVLKHIITPSVEKYGFTAIRADQISEPGIITTQIIQYIVESELVIADLTERNPNVFYELAIRHAIKKPLIQLIKKSEQIPFDVAAKRIIHFDIQDLDSVEQAKQEIENQIKSIDSGKLEYDNPISVSLELKILKESTNPEQRSLADIVEAITELRASVSIIDKKINSPDGIIPIDYLESAFNKLSRRFSPEFMMINERTFFELKDVTDRLQSFIDTKKFDDKALTHIKERILLVRERLEESMLRFRHFKY